MAGWGCIASLFDRQLYSFIFQTNLKYFVPASQMWTFVAFLCQRSDQFNELSKWFINFKMLPSALGNYIWHFSPFWDFIDKTINWEIFVLCRPKCPLNCVNIADNEMCKPSWIPRQQLNKLCVSEKRNPVRRQHLVYNSYIFLLIYCITILFWR